MGLYKHNKKNHIAQKPINNICKYCNKKLSSYKSKWRHEQQCCQTNDKSQIDIMQEEINLLKNKINALQVINNTINNTTNNTINSTQNIVCVFPLGQEPNNILTQKFINDAIDKYGTDAIIKMVREKHFNPGHPECHNFCVTAKNDIYAHIIDPETNSRKIVNKNDVFDKVYSTILSNVNSIPKSKASINETIQRINELPINKKSFKKLHTCMNEDAYHGRDLVLNTWKHAKYDNKSQIDEIRTLINNIKSTEHLFKK
jgi:hypothetical protein